MCQSELRSRNYEINQRYFALNEIELNGREVLCEVYVRLENTSNLVRLNLSECFFSS